MKFKTDEKAGQAETALGYIPAQHLSDDLEIAKSRYQRFSEEVPVGDLKDAALSSTSMKIPDHGVVLTRAYIPGFKDSEKDAKDAKQSAKQNPFVLITLKQSMVLASQADSFVKDVKDLQEGRFYSGYVKEIRDFGALISVGSWRLAGIAQKFELAHRFVEDVNEVLVVGQSVRARVKNIDLSKHRFEADLRPSALSDKLFLEREAEALHLTLMHRDFGHLKPGSMVRAEVTKIESYGVLLKVNEDITAVALKENMPEMCQVEIGKSLKCTILDFNAEAAILDVSLHPELLEKHGKPSKGMELLVHLALWKKSYIVCWSRKPAAVLFAPSYTPSTWKGPVKTILHTAESPMVILCPCPSKECYTEHSSLKQIQKQL